jgi:hypothetical protein
MYILQHGQMFMIVIFKNMRAPRRTVVLKHAAHFVESGKIYVVWVCIYELSMVLLHKRMHHYTKYVESQ